MQKKYIELDENLSLVENVDNNLLKEYRNEDFTIEDPSPQIPLDQH